MNLFDGHAHLRPTEEATAQILRTMDSANVAKACIVAGGTLSPVELSENMIKVRELNIPVDNITVKRTCDREPNRLLPFYFANPHEAVTEYRSHGKAFYGLKLGPTVHGVPLNDKRNLQYVEIAKTFAHPVYFHCLAHPGFDMEAALALVRQFPSVSFILGHAGIGNCDFYAVSLIKNERNLSFETSGGFSSVIQAAVNQLGAGRVIFGSEYPIQHPRLEIEKIRSLDLSESQRTQILEKNIDHLVMGRQRG